MKLLRSAAPAAGAFLATILAANYVTTLYPNIPVGFGLTATAGTLFAGLSFVLRDLLQDAIRAGLPNRLVFVESFREFGGRQLSLGVRRESRPPTDLQVAVRVMAVIGMGAALSAILAATVFRANPAFLPPGVTAMSIVAGSTIAFALSETADLLIYTPLRLKGYVRAALASNVVGSFVDTIAFLTIAGFPLRQAIAGQMVGKIAVTLVVIAAVGAYRARRWATA